MCGGCDEIFYSGYLLGYKELLVVPKNWMLGELKEQLLQCENYILLRINPFLYPDNLMVEVYSMSIIICKRAYCFNMALFLVMFNHDIVDVNCLLSRLISSHGLIKGLHLVYLQENLVHYFDKLRYCGLIERVLVFKI